MSNSANTSRVDNLVYSLMEHVHKSSNSSLQERLRAAAQHLHWTYAILWRSSPQQKLLIWDSGFYNGGVKTRKTVTPEDWSPEELSQQRTDQLRELYNMLSFCGENNQQVHRPCAALSPEDLTDTEWFYLLCMSFTFAPGNGLPGQAATRGNYIWLSNACEADSRLFKRAILAKTAKIQTVICVPIAEGVVELGTTEFVPEDAKLIHDIKGFFAEQRKPVCSEQSASNPQMGELKERQDIEKSEQGEGFNRDKQEFEQTEGDDPMPVEIPENDCSRSPVDSIGNPCPKQNLRTALNPGQKEIQQFIRASPVRNLKTQFPHGIHPIGMKQPLNISKHSCIDQKVPRLTNTPDPHTRLLPSTGQDVSHLEKILCKNTGEGSFESQIKEKESSAFSKWTSEINMQAEKPKPTSQQGMLKRILLHMAQLHGYGKDPVLQKRKESRSNQRQTARKVVHDETCVSHVLAERRRREKLNERFLMLRNMIPFITKVDKASILGDAIEYLKQLQGKVQELEEEKGQRMRKQQLGREAMVVVKMAEEQDGNVVIEVECEERRDLLLEMLQALKELHLHVHFCSCESSNNNHNGNFRFMLRAHQSGDVNLEEVEQILRRIVAANHQHSLPP